MKRILVVFTGGTMGSRMQNATIDVDEAAGYYLVKAFQDKYEYEVEFETIQPINILSENATPVHWQLLYDALRQENLEAYDGIIITHGSDTLSYTCAAIGFLMCHTRIPILLTASNYALEYKESNGMDNFCSCVDFISNSPIPGVFAVYQNNKEKNIVYLASRIMEADSYTDQYASFGGKHFGEIKNGTLKAKKGKLNPTGKKLLEKRVPLFDKLAFTNQILAIRSYPGLNYEFYDLKNKPKAVLHSLYHSATGCTGYSDYSLTEFIKRCSMEGIDTYLISFKSLDSDLYKSSRELLEYGAQPLQNISFEAAYAKLCIAYNQTAMPAKEYVEKELYFEYLPELKIERG